MWSGKGSILFGQSKNRLTGLHLRNYLVFRFFLCLRHGFIHRVELSVIIIIIITIIMIILVVIIATIISFKKTTPPLDFSHFSNQKSVFV